MISFKRFLENVNSITSNTAYHVTHKNNVQSILSHGLIGGKTAGFTLGGTWADIFYKTRPIYIALSRDKYKKENTSELKINTRGLTLYPDLPGLIDLGAMISDNGSIYWENDEDIPKQLAKFASDGEISIKDLLRDPKIISAAIDATQTAAVLKPIPATAISID